MAITITVFPAVSRIYFLYRLSFLQGFHEGFPAAVHQFSEINDLVRATRVILPTLASAPVKATGLKIIMECNVNLVCVQSMVARYGNAAWIPANIEFAFFESHIPCQYPKNRPTMLSEFLLVSFIVRSQPIQSNERLNFGCHGYEYSQKKVIVNKKRGRFLAPFS